MQKSDKRRTCEPIRHKISSECGEPLNKMSRNHNRTIKLISLIMTALCVSVWYYNNSILNTTSHDSQLDRKLIRDSDTEKLNILLLAYQRTGSSFLGELLSSHSSSFYLYEPSWKLDYERNVPESRQTAAFLRQLYGCDPSAFRLFKQSATASTSKKKYTDFYMSALFQRPKKFALGLGEMLNVTEVCRKARARVVKTIRYRMDAILELLKFDDVNVKIVHLVRDPRAIINSMNGHSSWKESIKDPAFQCDNIRNDLRLSKRVPKDRYILVRFEDVVNNTLDEAIRLFQFLKLPVHNTLASFIVTHSMQEHLPNKTATDDYSTQRLFGFQADHWKKTLPLEQRLNITNHCADVLSSLGYTYGNANYSGF